MKPTRSLVLMPLILCLAACSPRYVPNRLNVPMLREKNEFGATVNPRNAQLAYSPVKGLGVMANGFLLSQAGWKSYNNEDTDRFKQKIWLTEIGAGFYHPLSADSLWFVDFYSGYGVGKVKINIEEEDVDYNAGVPDITITKRDFSARQNRFFAQPSIGYSRRHIEFAFSARVTSLFFSDAGFTNFSPGATRSYGLRDIDKHRFLVVEPAFTIRGGIKQVKLETQIGYTNVLNSPADQLESDYVTSWLFLNFGLHVNIAPRHKK